MQEIDRLDTLIERFRALNTVGNLSTSHFQQLIDASGRRALLDQKLQSMREGESIALFDQ